MPIINVNAFQNGINQKDFLTSYTDVYLKQSLANLSQRTAAKGDSIGFSSFNMKELFPNYTGDFTANNLIVQAIEYPNENKVEGYLRLLSNNGKLISLSEDEANTKFIVNNINNILNGIGNEYSENEISLDNATINLVKYWHKQNAVFYSKENSFIYKLTGRRDGSSDSRYGDYDNEYICEEVDKEGKFVEGFRIFVINENNLTSISQDEAKEVYKNDSTAHERLALIHLYKTKDYKGNEVWKLSVYRISSADSNFVIGDIASDCDIVNAIRTYIDPDGSLSPSEIVNSLVTNTNDVYKTLLSGCLNKLYTVDVDYDSNKDANWCVSDEYIKSTWKSMDDKNSFSGSLSGQLAADSTNTGILADIDIICGDSLTNTTGKLAYFSYDVATLYPRVLEIFNEIMYKDSTNLKIKQRIISTLVHTCRTNYLKQATDSDEYVNYLYPVYFPITYEVKYNCNSNDLSQIYNLTSSLPVYFDDIAVCSDKEIQSNKNSVDVLKKIAYHFDTTENPSNYVIAQGVIEKTILYDLFLSYIDDNIISSFVWTINFTMPYISDNGYWVVNDIVTNNYAKGKVEDQANLIMMASTNPTEFEASTHILTGAGVSSLKAQGSESFEKKVFKSNYLQSNTNISSANLYNMQAWVPSDEYLKSIKDTDEFTYLQSAVIMAISSTSMEKDATITQFAYYNTNYGIKEGIVSGTYEEVKNTYESGKYLDHDKYNDWKVKNDVVSYIYRTVDNPNSINAIIGSNGIITSFWTCQQKEDKNTNSTYWSFDYIRKPDDENEIALDFNYIGNLEQYVKYYTKLRFNPDDYEHTQLLFDSAVIQLKNNTSDSTIGRVWPVLINHLCDYYNSELGTDPSRSLGESNNEETQYFNQLNFGLEFPDTIKYDDDGHVTEVENSTNRRFKINSYTWVDNVTYTYWGKKSVYDEKTGTYIEGDEYELKSGINQEKHKCGTIPKVIPYTAFEEEYIPNAEYDVDGNHGNQYPFFDMKEVLLKNVTTVNRNNIFAVEKDTLGDNSYGVIYNAYIGTAYDSPDKSILHIGTGSCNPNMGTTTMTDKDSITYLTPMKGMSIDFDQIYLNGYTQIKGELITDRPTWTKKTVADGYVTYTTLFYPNGTVEIHNTTDNTPIYNDELLSVETLPNKHTWTTRYYNNPTPEYVSYLNVTKLLRDNNISGDDNTVIYGDKYRLSERSNPAPAPEEKNDTFTKAIYLELSTDLTDRENFLGSKDIAKKENIITNGNLENNIVQANPIQVSYTDITTYNGIIYVPAYTYVHSYLTALSYQEYWYCEGCELCNEDRCSMINKCNKSSVIGYWQPAYEYAKLKEGEDAEVVLNSAENTYGTTHTRYRKTKNNKYEKYEVLAYYPIMKALSQNDFEDKETFEKALQRKDEKDNLEYLTYWIDDKTSTGQYVWMSMPNTDADPTASYTISEIQEHISSTIPVPRNIISAYVADYIKENETDETKYYLVTDIEDGIEISNKLISYSPELVDELDIKENGTYLCMSYTYVKITQGEMEVNGEKLPVTRYEHAIDKESVKCIFSYNMNSIMPQEYALSQRFVNVREVLTSHSRPEFFNENLNSIDVPDVPDVPVIPKPEDENPYDDANRSPMPVTYTYSYYILVTPSTSKMYDVNYKTNTFNVDPAKFTATAYAEVRQNVYDKVYKVDGYWSLNKEKTMKKDPDSYTYAKVEDIKIEIENGYYNENNSIVSNIQKVEGKDGEFGVTFNPDATNYTTEEDIKNLGIDRNLNSSITFKYETATANAKVTGNYNGSNEVVYELLINDKAETTFDLDTFSNLDDTLTFTITSQKNTKVNGITTKSEYVGFEIENINRGDANTHNFNTTVDKESDPIKRLYTVTIDDTLKETIKNYDFDNNDNKYVLEESWKVTQLDTNNTIIINLKIEIEKK